MYHKVNQLFLYIQDIHSFLDSFPIETIIESSVEFLMLYCRSLSVIYFIHSSVCIPVYPYPPFLPGNHKFGASLVAQLVKNLPAIWETQVRSLGWEELLGRGMVTHSSILV